MPLANIQTRLCPECANSIALDALICPYCKADLVRSILPEWPKHSDETERGDAASERGKIRVKKERIPIGSKIILALGLLLFALGVYLVGGTRERSDMTPVLAERAKALQEKDQKIESLETQLAQLRQEHQGSSSQIEDLKAKFEESQKELVSIRRKLVESNREVERSAPSRIASAPQAAARTADLPRPQPSPAPSRRPAEAGTYETLRQTTVYEEPSSSARAVAQIGKGTEVTVVRTVGEWLEVRSKHGKPPGYVRPDDVRLLARAN